MLPLAVLELAVQERGGLRRRVSLPLVVLVVGVLYFLWVALLGLRIVILTSLEPTITPEDWAVGGAVLMLVLLGLLLYDYNKHKDDPYATAAPAAQAPAYAPAPSTRWIPDELVVTAETVQGRRVLEYSRPPKSEHRAAVYAKVLVPVDDQLVLRVEDLIAEAKE